MNKKNTEKTLTQLDCCTIVMHILGARVSPLYPLQANLSAGNVEWTTWRVLEMH